MSNYVPFYQNNFYGSIKEAKFYIISSGAKFVSRGCNYIQGDAKAT
jgi:hypothetical protein